MRNLPSNMREIRIGGLGQSDYDRYGNLAPKILECGCGRIIRMEQFDYVSNEYIVETEEALLQFQEDHAECAITCTLCHTEPVGYVGDSCRECTDRETAIWLKKHMEPQDSECEVSGCYRLHH